MLVEIGLVALGLLLLVGGGESLIKGGVALALRMGVSSLMVGVTVIAYGTSTPELIVSLHAAQSGNPGIAVGNVVGSNICNILLILGITALIHPLSIKPQAIKRDGAFALIAVGLFIVAAHVFGTIPQWFGVLLILVLLFLTWLTYHQEKFAATNSTTADSGPIWKSAGFCIIGLALLILGADLLVDNATILARSAGISETVIGLTLVAVGTSLPELFASVIAAVRKQPDVALGNVIGSNIYNILAILGLVALLAPVDIPQQIIAADMWIMLAVTLLLAAVMLLTRRISRATGVVFLLLFAGYYYWLFQLTPAV